MHNRKLFDIVTLSDCIGCNYNNNLGSIIDDIKGIWDGIIDIFDGGGGGGLPGDYSNRVRQSHQWAVEKDVKECVDFDKLERLILIPSGWQSEVGRYLNELRDQKLRTGSCQSVFGAPGGVYSGASIFPVGSPLPMLLLAGGFLFLASQSKKKKRR